jgi:uncharacterized protein (TIGR00255 family)
MPIRSMTGFGQAKKTTPSGTYRIELRGVNNRYLEIQLRTPRSLSCLEQKIKQVIQENISRGSLTLNISWDGEAGETSFTWDKEKVSSYIKILKEVQSKFKLDGKVSIQNLLTLSDFIKVQTTEIDEEKQWHHIKPVLEKAIGQFRLSSETEAVTIVRQFRTMTGKIVSALETIEKRAPERLKNYQESLLKKVELLAGTTVEPQRLAAEIAMMSDRLDISEECTRLRGHIEKFLTDLDADEPAGKRMTFILQEMNREANTLGSKSNDLEISHLSVSIKETIEQMREQAQNIE